MARCWAPNVDNVAARGGCCLNAGMPPPPYADQPYNLLLPLVQTAPVVLTSPHSGRHYDPAFLGASRLDPMAIRRSEDSFVDELFAAAPALGMPLLAANFPRAYCDVNREAWELDPAMFEDSLPAHINTTSPRALAGLGTIARIVGNNEPIYAGKLRFAEAQMRVASCWEPYHAMLRRLVSATVQQFGCCLVIDCHSMPSLPGRHAPKAQIVLGDGYGTSCDEPVTAFLQGELEGLGLDVCRNEPYAGGYITRHYGRPREAVQAVQMELARKLYMNERQFRRGENFGQVQEVLNGLLTAVAAGALAALTANDGLAAAAE
jgi:N-formylglutamate amidohydrolase